MGLPPSLKKNNYSEQETLTRRYIYGGLRFLTAIVLAFFVCRIDTEPIESYFYDFRVKIKPASENTNNIELIVINTKTIQALSHEPNAIDHAKVLEKLRLALPSDIIYVTKLQDIDGSKADRKQLAETALSFGSNLYQVTQETELKGAQEPKLPAPFEKIDLESGPVTRDRNSFAKDNVTRRMMLTYLDKKLLHTKVAEKFRPELANLDNVKGSFNYLGTKQIYVDFNRKNFFSSTQFEDIYNDQVSLDKFKDKIVLIGEDLDKSSELFTATPYNHNLVAMTTLEAHANMLETLLRNSSPQRSPFNLNLAVTILLSILTVYVVLSMRPLRGMLMLLGAIFVYVVICLIAFWPFGIWLNMAQPFVAIFLCYYFFIPYRLIVENRRSWEYYQKHKLLTEVEELKTNFIGMMSHDLKTPLARIQGMADIIVSDTVSISNTQREAVDTIRQSSEDLLKFISTILNYAKIESQGVELHLESRDINQILKDVVKKHEFLARVKHIQLLTELEPLFSIKVDPELIRQSFSNLVENAIKYSPENSKVLITTEEIDGFVTVQVSDQGIGIPSDELPNVFMKFFRSKHAKSSPIKGSGLGLYLAKYFIELHKGRITVESTPGEGSTFTVELPVGS